MIDVLLVSFLCSQWRIVDSKIYLNLFKVISGMVRLFAFRNYYLNINEFVYKLKGQKKFQNLSKGIRMQIQLLIMLHSNYSDLFEIMTMYISIPYNIVQHIQPVVYRNNGQLIIRT